MSTEIARSSTNVREEYKRFMNSINEKRKEEGLMIVGGTHFRKERDKMRNLIIIIVMLLSTLGPAAVIGVVGYAAVKAVGRNPSASARIPRSGWRRVSSPRQRLRC